MFARSGSTLLIAPHPVSAYNVIAHVDGTSESLSPTRRTIQLFNFVRAFGTNASSGIAGPAGRTRRPAGIIAAFASSAQATACGAEAHDRETRRPKVQRVHSSLTFPGTDLSNRYASDESPQPSAAASIFLCRSVPSRGRVSRLHNDPLPRGAARATD
jgi:hypothetical protein